MAVWCDTGGQNSLKARKIALFYGHLKVVKAKGGGIWHEEKQGMDFCSEVIVDNCQDTIFGGFAPKSQTAEVLSKALGSRTVMSGSISRGKNDPSQSLQMIERPLMTADELKSIPKGNFVVMKTGTHLMKTRLRLFLDWGITFGDAYTMEEKSQRKMHYADKQTLEENIVRCHMAFTTEYEETGEIPETVGGTGALHAPAAEQTKETLPRRHIRT